MVAPHQLDRDILALAFETSGDGIALLALDGTVVVINAGGAAALASAGPEEMVGRPWSDLWRGEDRILASVALETARSGTPGTFSASLPFSDGAERRWDNTVTPLSGADGGPDRLLVMSRNVTREYEATRALDRSVRLQRALIQATSEIVWHADVTTGVTKRRGYAEFTGREDNPQDMDGWLSEVHPEDHTRAKQAADDAELTRAAMIIEYRLHHVSNVWRWVEDHATPILDDDGAVTDWVGIITDIHDRKIAEQALQKNAEHLRLAIEATGLGTWDVDERTGEREWSPELFDLLRLPRDTPATCGLFLERIHPEDRARVARELNACPPPSAPTQVCMFRLLFPSGEEQWVEVHERTFFDGEGHEARRVGTLQDITARKQAERELWLAAHADALTGIANRALFQSQLDAAVADAAANDRRVGLLLVDLDRFKEVNDALGHDAGDALLRTVADRLRSTMPPTATVARLGGDEFGVVLPASGQAADVERLADRLLATLRTPMNYMGREVDCSTSIGWSVYPDHDPEPAALLKNADVALYAAKAAGRGRALAFTTAMRDEMARRINVLRAAKDALIRDAVMPFYQPKVSLATGAIVGFEALLRWTDESGLRPPAALGEAFDDPDLATKLGARMLERAVADMQAWTHGGCPFGHVALNVGAPEFHGQPFADRILDALGGAGLRPHQLEIEVTERVLLDDGAGAIGTALKQLVEAGVPIALDDFGTGYASLTHLTKFSVGWLKIDRSFVMTMQSDPATAAIIRAVVGLAHSIGIRVVAEGIETPEQFGLLRATRCDLGQGYLIAKPMPASRVPGFLTRWAEGAGAVAGLRPMPAHSWPSLEKIGARQVG